MANARPIPQAALTFHPDTGLFGFSVWFEGKRPHFVMDTFSTLEAAKTWIDPLNERIWEDLPPVDGGAIAISRSYRRGSVPTLL